MEPK